MLLLSFSLPLPLAGVSGIECKKWRCASQTQKGLNISCSSRRKHTHTKKNRGSVPLAASVVSCIRAGGFVLTKGLPNKKF
jgi:hypothetical protein